MVKPRLYSTDDAVSQNAALWTLKTVLIDALKLLHPYMPFITEEIFCTIQNEEESIMISKWPEYSEDRAFPAEEKAIETKMTRSAGFLRKVSCSSQALLMRMRS